MPSTETHVGFHGRCLWLQQGPDLERDTGSCRFPIVSGGFSPENETGLCRLHQGPTEHGLLERSPSKSVQGNLGRNPSTYSRRGRPLKHPSPHIRSLVNLTLRCWTKNGVMSQRLGMKGLQLTRPSDGRYGIPLGRPGRHEGGNPYHRLRGGNDETRGYTFLGLILFL